jgi:phosphotransferase system enzyme I (PtsP)
VREGDPLLLDADQGIAFVRPRDMVIAFDERFAKTRERQAAYAALRDVAAGDGLRRAHHGDGQCRPA